MKVYAKNIGEISLNNTNYISSGGEGNIYAKNNMAYKIYNDPSKVISEGKINELSVLTKPNIIKPEYSILDKNNTRIGYSMRFIKDTFSLCQLFTRAFKERNNINQDKIQFIIKELYDIIDHVHSNKILIVDCNELNFLVSNSFNEVFSIDVDSFQTPHYHATALMESIRDRHCINNSFNENTDWFAFAIISFQIFIGVHPYKGKYSKDTLMSLDDRMIKNLSVFNKNVSVPKVCYPLNSIPQSYKDWYKAVFDDGKRFPPPKDFQGAIVISIKPTKINGTDNFDINLYEEYDGTVLDIYHSGGIRAALTNKKLHINAGKNLNVSSNVKIITSQKSDNIILAKTESGKLKLFNTESNKEISCNIFASDIMVYNNNLYIKCSDSILELQLNEIGQNILPSTLVIGTVLENSSKLYDGVIIQDLLGACYVSIFPTSKIHKQIHIKELDGAKILDAKYSKNVLMIVAIKKAEKTYSRFVIRIDKDSSYDIREIVNITPSGLNFVVLDNGVCICLTEEEELELFSSSKNSSSIKIINDPILSGDMKLFYAGGKTYFAKDNKLYSMTMKAKQ